MIGTFFVSSILATIICHTDAAQIRTINNCPFTVWVGAFGTQYTPENGGWRLNSGEAKTVDIPVSGEWNGRFWGRTDCDQNGRCLTGTSLSSSLDETSTLTMASGHTRSMRRPSMQRYDRGATSEPSRDHVQWMARHGLLRYQPCRWI